MTPVLAVAGWAAAVCGGAGAVFAWRTLSTRMERVARACHELRGPITAARLGLELGVRRGALSPARLRALDLELGRAALAIDELAEHGCNGRSTSRWEEVDLRGLLVDSVEAWRGAAEARGASLTSSWSGPPALVFADRLRLAQATGNLIANAIGHGGGAVEVRVQARLPGDVAGGADFPPTETQYDSLRAVEAEMTSAIGEYQKLLNEDLPTLNRSLTAQNVAAVVAVTSVQPGRKD